MTKKKKKSKRFEAPFDSADFLPNDGYLWRSIIEALNKVTELYDFNFIKTPMFEFKGLFESAIGEGGDITGDNILDFELNLSKKNKKLSFRPEGNTSLMRSYLENKLGRFSSPLRSYYIGSMYRKEKDNIKKFNEAGFSIIGDSDTFYDIEVIMALFDFLNEVKIKNPVLKINSSGCRVCRPSLEKKIKKHYRYHKKKLCDNCLIKYEKAPIYLLSCENKKCKEVKEQAPNILNCLCQSCNNQLKEILELIEDNGINYIPDPYFLGRIDYYSKITYEIIIDNKSEVSLAHGGRIDYLSERIGGRQLPATSGVLQLDNIIRFLKDEEIKLDSRKRRKVFFVAVGKEAKKSCVPLIKELRSSSIVVLESLGKKSLNSQLKIAEKSDVSIVLMYGQKEVFENTIIIRNTKTGAQETVPTKKMLDIVRNKL
ncbi:MAG: HisS family protein [Candidatus Paceibacterota bacterium]